MIKTEDYNNVSEKLLKKYQLKPGETATFISTQVRFDPINKAWKMPTVWTVPNIDWIYDPIANESVQIAAIKRTRPSKDGPQVEFHEIRFQRDNAGQIHLSGSRPQDRNLYTFLMLSTYRDFEGRDTALPPPFYRLMEPDKESKEKNTTRRRRTEAITRVYNMTEAEIKLFASSRGRNPNIHIEVLRDELAELAERDPDKILASGGDELRNALSVVNRAMSESVIKFDGRGNKFKWTDTNEVIYQSPDQERAAENFAGWLLMDKDRKVILDNLESKIEKL